MLFVSRCFSLPTTVTVAPGAALQPLSSLPNSTNFPLDLPPWRFPRFNISVAFNQQSNFALPTALSNQRFLLASSCKFITRPSMQILPTATHTNLVFCYLFPVVFPELQQLQSAVCSLLSLPLPQLTFHKC